MPKVGTACCCVSVKRYRIQSVQPTAASNLRSTLTVNNSSLEDDRYRVRLDQNGDVSSIYDKGLKKGVAFEPDSPRYLDGYAEDLSGLEYGI